MNLKFLSTGFSIQGESIMGRFNTDNAYIWHYGDHFLVECPTCRNCAQVLTRLKEKKPDVRISCLKCGYSKKWTRTDYDVRYHEDADYFENGHIWVGASVDWYFHHPLWLRISCCGSTLWAYNAAHLSWIKSFVAAKLRERTPNEAHGWSNQSLASRLPKWIKQKNNRDALLSAVKKLEQKLEIT